MNTFRFDLILSGFRRSSSQDLVELTSQLKAQGCSEPNPRIDKNGVRISVAIDASTFTQAIYLSTQCVTNLPSFSLSVRSVEFN